MLPAFTFIAALCAALFAGAALYITLAEYPARMELETRLAALQWAPSYQRATWMQVPLALLSFLSGVAAWLIGAGLGWLVAAVLIGAVVPFTPNGMPGKFRVHATLPDNLGCDDFAFDVLGNLYCTTDPFDKLLRIFPDGSFESLLTAAHGLDYPTAAAFGRHGQDRFNLYITNTAFPFFSTTQQPSLIRLHLEVPGWPGV